MLLVFPVLNSNIVDFALAPVLPWTCSGRYRPTSAKASAKAPAKAPEEAKEATAAQAAWGLSETKIGNTGCAGCAVRVSCLYFPSGFRRRCSFDKQGWVDVRAFIVVVER